MAVATRVRYIVVRRQVHGPQEGRAVGRGVQQVDAHGRCDRRSYKNVEIQHDEGEWWIHTIEGIRWHSQKKRPYQ